MSALVCAGYDFGISVTMNIRSMATVTLQLFPLEPSVLGLVNDLVNNLVNNLVKQRDNNTRGSRIDASYDIKMLEEDNKIATLLLFDQYYSIIILSEYSFDKRRNNTTTNSHQF